GHVRRPALHPRQGARPDPHPVHEHRRTQVALRDRADAMTTATFLVEHYWPGVTAESFRRAAEQVRRAAEVVAAASADISFVHSTRGPEDWSAFCVFEAWAPALVEEAYFRSCVAF